MTYQFFRVATIMLLVMATSTGFTQATDSAKRPGIVIVPKLEKPKKAAQLNEKNLGGYLLVYFKDPTHSAYFAISKDGYTFTDVNGGQPLFIGSQLAEQKGVRDPHIARGPDGAFYLAMTDLHIFGQRAGFRGQCVGTSLSKVWLGQQQGACINEVVRSYSLDAF